MITFLRKQYTNTEESKLMENNKYLVNNLTIDPSGSPK